ncbi:MAG: tRNA 2-thiouridine(34) synthase MnmA [Treponema sp.]|jgi:tRNA-specific 2-thiouridylase|nr:tRNA 2-thiouridine(34) synthase MnmA [Treponema sp.]
MGEKALIAMSGGVDSSVAAALMAGQGFDCIGVTLKLYDAEDTPGGGTGFRAPPRGCCSLADVNDARDAAYKLGIPHYVLNFTEVFCRQVICRFVETYEAGATPNPCIDCNRYVKFDRLLFRARQLDFDLLVTGHYARIEKERGSGRFLLKKSADTKKDQSYVLYCLSQEQLASTRFPLGDLTKVRVREIAADLGFINAKKRDSQDICFVPAGDYGAFMEKYRGRKYPEGNIVDPEGRILGRHRGVVRYTLGQRRGLGVAVNEAVYVAAKNMADNTVTLGPESSLYTRTLTANRINLIACRSLDKPLRVTVKTRYLQRENPAAAVQIGPDELRIVFDEGQRAVTPGQAAVLYDGDIVVGGGTITSAE